MVTIIKRPAPDGSRYELADFSDYVAQLKQSGVEPPLANYQVYVSLLDEAAIRRSVTDFDEQIARFFKLSPITDVAYQIQDET